MPLSNRLFQILLTFTFTFICLQSFGQQAQDHFGKNRIQYKQLDWEYISTYNFEIYYYKGGKELAYDVANYAESGFHRIVDQTGFTPYSKIKILVYNTASDLQQSNIGLDYGNGLMGDGLVGGQTQFVKSKMEISFMGSQARLKRDVEFLLAEMFINIMLYGGSLKDIVQSSYLLSLPDWYISGAAAYLAEGWSQEMDNYMRDQVLKGKFKKPTILTGKDAMITGQSIWNYIAERYGKHSIANILNLTRVVRNEEAGIESSLGIPYTIFIKDWRNFYLESTAPLTLTYAEAPPEERIIKNKKGYTFRNIQISPDGKKVSYIRNRSGRYSLVIYDIEKKKKHIIQRGGHKLLHQQEDPNILLHAWKTSEIIAFAEKKQENISLNFLDISSGKREQKIIKEFNQFTSFSFSSDGNKIVISGDKSGQTDIFVYNIDNNNFIQLTNDLYDDLTPIFVDNYSIAFCSNRLSDTLPSGTISLKNIQPLYNIFIIDINQTSNKILDRITEFGNNTTPVAISNKEIVYISNEKGIRNIYKYSLLNNESIQLTSYVRDVINFDINHDGHFAYIIFNKGSERIYYKPNLDFNPELINLPLTQREKLFEQDHPRKNRQQSNLDTTTESTEIDINDYQFESDIKKKNRNNKTTIYFSSGSKPQKDEIKFKGPSPYLGTFGLDRVNSTFMVDPLRGTGVLLEADMGDMMGNHRMNGGIFLLTNLKSSSIFGEYLYLKKRVDFKLRYDRKVIYYANDVSTIHQYTLNRFTATASYPLSTSSRISISPFITTTRFTDLSTAAFSNKDITTFYSGIQGQYIYDNTSVTGLNIIEGTRGKVTFEKYLDPVNNSKNFGKLIVDLRHYHSLHKSLILATRASYGEFFGNSPKRFLLGGMDNWLFNNTNHPSNDPLALTPFIENSNLLFVEYVTNMRGFNYNTQNGTKYVLFNAELRWPIIKYFYNGVINSNFLKNLQLVGFTDVGASWTGRNPFSTDNSTNTTFIGGGSSPFSAKVTNYKNPFLIGYGIGVRTMILGYYVKGDFAWGMEDYKVVNKKFYLTLGFDF